MKKALVAAIAVVVGFTVAAKADLLVEYTFTGSVGSAAATNANLSANALSVSAGSITFVTTGGTAAFPNTPIADTSGGFGSTQAADFANSKFFSFTITADVGYTFSITNISFLYRQTGALAAIQSAISINGTQLNSIAFAGSNTTGAFDEGITGYNDLNTATIGIHGWDATSTGGNFRLDDIVVEGSVIPEPGTLMLLGMGAGLLAFIRRRIR